MAVDILPPVAPVTDLWPRLARCPALPVAVPEPDPAPLPVLDDVELAARHAAHRAFVASLRPLVLAATTALHDRYPASLAHRSLPGCEQAWDDALAAWELLRATLEGRTR
jgi:hypothetical protein